MKLVYVLFISLLGTGTAEELSDFDDAEARSSWQKVDDMILSPLQSQILYSPGNIGKNALIDLTYRWKDGIVPYEVTSEFDDNDKKLIESILNEEYGEKTCARFRPRTKDDEDYVQVVNKKGCWSKIGRVGNMQELSLEKPKCMNRRAIAHEFLHSLGLYHQHSASNRDDYLDVKWENIQKGMEHNFRKYEPNRISDFGEPYDYDSIMHYPEEAFSANNKPTMVAKKTKNQFGYATSLSASDINKVNKMYNCKV